MKLEAKLEKVYALVLNDRETRMLTNILGGRKPDPYDSQDNRFCQKLYDMLYDMLRDAEEGEAEG